MADRSPTPTRWARLISGRHPAPALRLFCIPYAGAGASVYHGWRLPAEFDAEVWALQPPGRENRRQEPAIGELDRLVESFRAHLTPLLDRPFAIFGHSLGALLAFELTRLLRRSGGLQPRHLFLSGYRAPHRPPKRVPASSLPDDQFLARLLEMAGPSPSAIRDRDLMLLLAPMTRSDFRQCERYTYTPETPLAVPLTCFAATDDCEVDVADVNAWDQHTVGRYRLHYYQGGHLFVRDHARQMLADIATDLRFTYLSADR